MDLKQEMMRMLPAWILGLVILFIVYKSKYRPLIRVQPKSIKYFCGMMVVVAIFRLFLWHFFHRMTIIPVDMKAVEALPWQTSFFVFWEDATYVLPFMIFKRIIANKKYMRLFYYTLMGLMCFSFGAGHLYQSVFTGIAMMFYIPLMMDAGEQVGIGTVMICHTIFDLMATGVTLLALRGL
jgi:hypothetical protein